MEERHCRLREQNELWPGAYRCMVYRCLGRRHPAYSMAGAEGEYIQAAGERPEK